MRMFKRSILILALALWLATPLTRATAQEHGAAVESTKAAAHDATTAVERTAQHSGEAMGEEHEAKPPLLPDPTSRETILSALWVVIIFVVLLIVLYPTAWRNVLAGLKSRENRIRQDI